VVDIMASMVVGNPALDTADSLAVASKVVGIVAAAMIVVEPVDDKTTVELAIMTATDFMGRNNAYV